LWGSPAAILSLSSAAQELMTAAMGLNSSLITDTKRTPPHEASDQKALSCPSFVVTQALVSLLATSCSTADLVDKMKGECISP
jgi:hypothetical protein